MNFKRLQVTVQVLGISFFAAVVLFSEFRTPTVRTITFGLVVIDLIWTIWVLLRKNVLTMTPAETKPVTKPDSKTPFEPTKPKTKTGCGCGATDASGGLVFAGLLVLLRRRRRIV